MMAVDPSRLRYQQRKLHLKELHRRAKNLLSHRERDSLYASLKEYQAYRQVRYLHLVLREFRNFQLSSVSYRNVEHIITSKVSEVGRDGVKGEFQKN